MSVHDSQPAIEHVVPEGTPPERVDRYAFLNLGFFASRKQARLALKRSELTLNGVAVESSRFVRPGDRVACWRPVRPLPAVHEIPIHVAWEDDHLALVDKPAGIRVMGRAHCTVEHALPFNLTPSTEPDALPVPRPVHRLDVPTGGLLVCAKTARAQVDLGHQFQRRQVHKRYRAIAVGRLEGEGEVSRPIEARDALSRYRVVSHTRCLHCEWITTVDLWPVTGRTHQLRIHLAHLGHPVLGDKTHGTRGTIYRGNGLFLRSLEVSLTHPITREPLHAILPEPPKFDSHRVREARRWSRHYPDDPD